MFFTDGFSNHWSTVCAIAAAIGLAMTSCSPDTAGRWGSGDQIAGQARWNTEDAHGPLEAPGEYLGHIGEQLYFAGNDYGLTGNRRATVFDARSSQWEYAPAAITQASQENAGGRERIVEADGESYLLAERTSELYRSSNSGRDWQALSGVPDSAYRLMSDGQSLFVLTWSPGGGTDNAALWKSTDRGQNWSQIQDHIYFDNARVLPNQIVAIVVTEASYLYMRSTDGGASWQELGSVDDLGAARSRMGEARWQWKAYDGRRIAAAGMAESERIGAVATLDDDGLVDYVAVDGLAEDDYLAAAVPCGGQVYATVGDASHATDHVHSILRFGRLDVGAMRWHPLNAPPGAHPISQTYSAAMYCAGGDSLLLVTDIGLWESDDGAANWRQVGSPFSTPGYVFRWQGDLYSGQQYGAAWVQPAGEARWRGSARLPGLSDAVDDRGMDGVSAVTREGSRLYVTVESGDRSGVYRMNGPSESAQLIWHEHAADITGSIVEAHGESVAIATESAYPQLFISQDAGEHLHQVDLPETDGISAPTSMCFYRGRFWAAIGHQMWSTDLDNIDWRRETKSLPDEYFPDQLRIAGGRLFSIGWHQVYQRVHGGWRAVLSNDELRALGLAADGAVHFDAPRLTDMTIFDGELVVASDAKLLRVTNGGDFKLVDQANISRLFNLGTELYAGVVDGGLVRLANEPHPH